jgi:hypothetical protein
MTPSCRGTGAFGDHLGGSDHLFPGIGKALQKFMALTRERVVLPWRPRLGLHPFVLDQPRIFQPCQQRIQRSFHHDHPGVGQFINHVRRINLAPADDVQDAVLQDPLPHLHLCVFQIHIPQFIVEQLFKFVAISDQINEGVLCMTKYFTK